MWYRWGMTHSRVTPETVTRIILSQQQSFTHREELAVEYGVTRSTISRILRGDHPLCPPGYSPDSLAKPTFDQARSGSRLKKSDIDLIRETACTRYTTPKTVADRYHISTGHAASILANRVYTDPGYNPLKRKQRDEYDLTQMRKTGVVYGLRCTCHPEMGVMYVGQTVQNPKTRLSNHLSASRNPKCREYYFRRSAWIREHGEENIDQVILEEKPERGIDAAERYWISHYNTYGGTGLNMTPGGSNGLCLRGEDSPASKLTQKDVESIIRTIGSDKKSTSGTLAREYGVTNVLIRKIDRGEVWSHLDRPYGLGLLGPRNNRGPSSDELVRAIQERHLAGAPSMTQIARELGTTLDRVRTAIKKIEVSK